MDKKKTYQVNNLKIKYSKIYEKWQVITPTKKVLEEFKELKDAVKFAKETQDFVRKMPSGLTAWEREIWKEQH